jgi:Flp pilus assembly protein TadD
MAYLRRTHSVGLKSQTYNEKNRAGIFYSESWAFVHMLYLTPEYGPNFPKFILAMHRGKSAAEASELAFGRSSAQVYADLQAYLRRNRLFGAIYDVKLTPSEEEAQVSKPAPFESEMVQADLLTIVNKRDQAAAAYRKLEAESPGRPEIAQAMGYLAWQNNDHDGARQQFRKALDAGGRDPQMCFDLGMLELETDQASAKAAEALSRALEVKPDYTDARLRLGFLQLNARQFSQALATLTAIHKIDDENAPSLFNALAYANLQAGFRDEARRQAETALKWDKTDAEKQRTEQLLRILNEPDPVQQTTVAATASVDEGPAETDARASRGTAHCSACYSSPCRGKDGAPRWRSQNVRLRAQKVPRGC